MRHAVTWATVDHFRLFSARAAVERRLEFGGKLTPGPLSPHKRALMGGVGALVNSYG